MKPPLVSLVIISHNHLDLIRGCMDSLQITTGVDYEVVVVDNATTDPETLDALKRYRDSGRIDTLILSPVNNMLSEGYNIGVRSGNQKSEYVVLLNNDVLFLHKDWLLRMIQWMHGHPCYLPSYGANRDTHVGSGLPRHSDYSQGVIGTFSLAKPVRDIVSYGWSNDPLVEHRIRPEGFCCMIRRSCWIDISPDFPFYSGLDEMFGTIIKNGARCGVLSYYGKYFYHIQHGSGGGITITNQGFKRESDLPGWYKGVKCELLDEEYPKDGIETGLYLEW